MKIAKAKSELSAAECVIRAAIHDAMQHAETAVQKAIHVGFLLLEAKPLVGHTNFQAWISKSFPEISYPTANRWMNAAQCTLTAAGVQPHLLSMPVSEVFSTASKDLPQPAQEAQQLLLDFTLGKTIKECMAGVIVDGDEPHRITRAANGKKHGGTAGEDRKDYPKFIGQKLSDVSAHLKNWQHFTGAQILTTEDKFKSALAKWPTPILNTLKKLITEELKTR